MLCLLFLLCFSFFGFCIVVVEEAAAADYFRTNRKRRNDGTTAEISYERTENTKLSNKMLRNAKEASGCLFP